jgi:hypothetical protein
LGITGRAATTRRFSKEVDREKVGKIVKELRFNISSDPGRSNKKPPDDRGFCVLENLLDRTSEPP